MTSDISLINQAENLFEQAKKQRNSNADESLKSYHQALMVCQNAIKLDNFSEPAKLLFVQISISLAQLYNSISIQNYQWTNNFLKDNEQFRVIGFNGLMGENGLTETATLGWIEMEKIYQNAYSTCPSYRDQILISRIETSFYVIYALISECQKNLKKHISLLFTHATVFLQDINTVNKALIDKEQFKKIALMTYEIGLVMGQYGDKIAKSKPKQAQEYYQLAVKSLKIAQSISPDGETGKSVMSMYIRCYHTNSKTQLDQLEQAKQYFEQDIAHYPSHLGEMAYNRACIAGLENQCDKVIEYLAIAKKHDELPSRSSVLSDRDFNLIKDDKEFLNWIEANLPKKGWLF